MKEKMKIHLWNFAKLQALMLGLIGLVCGILYSFGGFLIDALVSMGVLSAEAMSTPGLSAGTLLAFGALIGMPLIFAFFGLLLGLIEGFLFNLLPGWSGRIKTNLDLEDG